MVCLLTLIDEFQDTCKWRAKIRLLKDPDAMIANPELMRIENFSVISNPKGHHHSYHCQQMNLDPDTLHKKEFSFIHIKKTAQTD